MTAAEAGEETPPLPGPVELRTFVVHWLDGAPSTYTLISGSHMLIEVRMLVLLEPDGMERLINIDSVSAVVSYRNDDGL